MTLAECEGRSQHDVMRGQICIYPLNPLSRGFSLFELMLVLALLAVLMWIAVPRYGAQQDQGRSAAMQLELMACAQALHALALAADPGEDDPWLLLADSDGDGDGDAASGELANNICPLSPSTRNDFAITVIGSSGGFELQARPSAIAHAATLTLDHLGRQRWSEDE